MSEVRALIDSASIALLRPVSDIDWMPPMLATLTERRFSDQNWLFERKLDGVRTIVTKAAEAEQPRLWSRNHKSMNASYPELVGELATRGPARFIADGEIVAFDGQQTSFAKLQPRIHVTKPEDIQRTSIPFYLYLFDLLALGDVDIRKLPLRDRKRLLRQVFDFGDMLRFSTHRNAIGEQYYNHACQRGWEGLIAKRANSPYQSGRSSDWLKFKCIRQQEFVIGGFTDPQGSRIGFGALLVGYYEKGRLCYAGKVGTGYNQPLLRSLHKHLLALTEPSSPFNEPIREPRVHWTRPQLVAQIGFTEWTSDHRLRHPRFIGLRNDKDPKDVTREA